MQLLLWFNKATRLKGRDFIQFISSHPFLLENQAQARKFIDNYQLTADQLSAIQTYNDQPYYKLLGLDLSHEHAGRGQQVNLSHFLKLIIEPASTYPDLRCYFLYSLGKKDKFLSYLLHATRDVDASDHINTLKSQLRDVIKKNKRPDGIQGLSIAAKVLLWRRYGDEIINARGYTVVRRAKEQHRRPSTVAL